MIKSSEGKGGNPTQPKFRDCKRLKINNKMERKEKIMERVK